MCKTIKQRVKFKASPATVYDRPDPSIRLILIAGNVYSKDEPKLRELFAEKGWTFVGPAEVADGLRAFAGRAYENDVVTFVTKLLERNR
ncbi:MAG TPA: hypothetical protein VMS12_03080 [Thermoanaerobaculia bacterium]|nr:hypothetical protein [Thermoanaerobaculia bacterium]